jgi:hypothetical protein
MTIREMHIEIDQSLNQVASHRTRKYTAGEKDWVLNKMLKRFIQSRLSQRKDGSGGWDLDQIAADSIRTLVVTGYDLVPYIDPNESRYKCYLPPDYGYLLSDWSYTSQVCARDPVTFALVQPTVVNQNLYITALRQDYSPLTVPLYYVTLSVNMPNTAVAIPANLPYGANWTGLPSKEDVSSIKDWLTLSGGWYWERFGSLRYPGYYILTSTTAPIGAPNVVVDGTTFSQVESLTMALQYHTSANSSFYDNRLTSPSKISGLNSTKFYQTSYYGPISELSQNILYVYRDESFIVTQVGISYVRKPIPMSLSLNTGCELPEDFHQQICDLAVEYLKGRLENQVGKALLTDDIERRVTL